MKNIRSYILSDQPIGKGGMATVYEARHKTSGERLAIKFLNAAYSSDVNIRKRFIEEGRRMAAMNHEHIVRVVGVVEEQGTLAIVMQLIDGMSLKEYIETHGRLPDHGIARIIQDISSALSYVHSKGIIHRDVSASNIMIDRSGNAYLMDFGISKYLTDGRMASTQTGLMMGSPIYMSPEQVRDSSRVGIQSDIYSFGVVIWQMVTCKVPYGCEGMSVYDILNKVVNEPLSKTGTKWDRIIQRATRKNPAERYGNLNELAASWDDIIIEPGPTGRSKIVLALLVVMVISITLLVYNYNDDNKSSKVEKNLIGDLVLVKGGTYKMGCVEQQNDCNNDELPVHQVTLHDFYIGKTEVTVGQFKAFVDATNYQTEAEKDGGSYIWEASGWVKIPGADWRCDIMGQKRPSSDYHYPVIHVSWNDAMAFVNWLNGVTKSRYYLPTEAEWEFAARGGLNSGGYIYAGSDNLGEVGWYGANSNFTVHPVSKKKPNELELHDMSGNVWEWCADWYGKYASSNQSNPQGPPKGNYRIFRGGSWLLGPMYCRVSARSNSTASFRNAYLGFRLAKRP